MVVVESYKLPEQQHLPRTLTCRYHVMTEDISVDHTAFDQCTLDAAEPPKVVVALKRVVISDEHAEAVVLTPEDGHKPLPVVEYVQIYDMAVAVRRYCCSLLNIPLPR